MHDSEEAGATAGRTDLAAAGKSGPDPSGRGPVGDYERLPYQSMPFEVTQPSHLAAIGKLFGLHAPAVETARVLELGCAGGGNLVPLAARFPAATFVGVDLSTRHVAEAQAFAEALGLANVRIEQADIAELRVEPGSFDYVICHGVYSWAPPAARDAVLAIAGRALSPTGLAYISYNVFPGWRLRSVIRDMGLLHVGVEGDPRVRVARFRSLLAELATLTDETKSFGHLLRHEAEQIARHDDSYIHGEFFAPVNEPCYFHEFAARAADHGLTFVSEAELALSVPELLGPERGAFVRRMAGADGPATEQYIDFVSGRAFRRSVLARSDALAERRVRADAIRTLHVSSKLQQDGAAAADGRAVFAHGGARITTGDPGLSAAFVRLAELYPATSPYEDLVVSAADRSGAPRDRFEPDLLQALFRTVLTGQTRLSATPIVVGRATGARPRLWAVAEAQVRAGQPWLSSQLHAPIHLHPALHWLAGELDGRLDRTELERRLAGRIAAGAFAIKDLGPDAGEDRLRAAARVFLDRLLTELARGGLLAADP